MRHCLLCLSLVATMLFSLNESLFAQAPAPATPPANVTKVQRPYYVEGTVVVLLMAAAGYAVCRSSRRV